MPNTPADEQRINAIRFLSVDAVDKAKSGHPGLPLGAAGQAYALWTRHLRVNPQNPHWFNRDRFVLSAGHGSALLYSLLYLFGFSLTLDDLKSFRRLGSKTPDIRSTNTPSMPAWKRRPVRSAKVSPMRSAWRSLKRISLPSTIVPRRSSITTRTVLRATAI